MAVRLNVLVLRPPGNGSSWHAQCDDAIGQLLGRPGLDLTLLERLPQPGDGSTERLALESIGGHVACLAWQEPAELIADFKRAGRPMVRRRHAADPDCEHETVPAMIASTDANVARMYLFDMRGFANREPGQATGILVALQSLLKTLQLPTFQIASQSSVPKRTTINSVAAQSMQAAAITPITVSRSSGSSEQVNHRPPAASSIASSKTSAKDDLDRLVDELDELDI